MRVVWARVLGGAVSKDEGEYDYDHQSSSSEARACDDDGAWPGGSRGGPGGVSGVCHREVRGGTPAREGVKFGLY